MGSPVNRLVTAIAFSAIAATGLWLAGGGKFDGTAHAQSVPPQVIVDRDPVVDALQQNAWAGPSIHDSPVATTGNIVLVETTGNRQDVAITFINGGVTRLDVYCPPGTQVGQVLPGSSTAILCQIQAISTLRLDAIDIGRGLGRTSDGSSRKRDTDHDLPCPGTGRYHHCGGCYACGVRSACSQPNVC